MHSHITTKTESTQPSSNKSPQRLLAEELKALLPDYTITINCDSRSGDDEDHWAAHIVNIRNVNKCPFDWKYNWSPVFSTLEDLRVYMLAIIKGKTIE